MTVNLMTEQNSILSTRQKIIARALGVVLSVLIVAITASVTFGANFAVENSSRPVGQQIRTEGETPVKALQLDSGLQTMPARLEKIEAEQNHLKVLWESLDQRVKEAGANAFDLNYKFQGNVLSALAIVLTFIIFLVTALFFGTRAWLRSEYEKFEKRSAEMADTLQQRADSILTDMTQQKNKHAEEFQTLLNSLKTNYEKHVEHVAAKVTNRIVDIAKLRVNAGVYLRVGHEFWCQFQETEKEEGKLGEVIDLGEALAIKLLKNEKKRNLDTAIRMTEVALDDANELHALTPDFDHLLALASNNIAYYMVSRDPINESDRAKASLHAREAFELARRYKEREDKGEIAKGEAHWYLWWETYCWTLFNNDTSTDKHAARELMREVCKHPTPPTEWKEKKQELYSLH